MRLEIFDFIDNTMDLIGEYEEVIKEGERELGDFFEELFLQEDNVLNIVSRVKSKNSLKEKIFSKKFIRFNWS